jgi:hypothetical protein
MKKSPANRFSRLPRRSCFMQICQRFPKIPGARLKAGSEFDALVALGPSILPLVVEKLSDPENFFALTLYDAIQPDENLVVQFAPRDERVLEGNKRGHAGWCRLGSQIDKMLFSSSNAEHA